MSTSPAPESWGRFPRSTPADVVTLAWRTQIADAMQSSTRVLAYGLGRSYGDVCLNNDGTLIVTSHLDRFISFDPTTGVLRCEAGVSLAAILDLVVPHGWFLPVTPGTKYVTVGGAIANDVHGKNHHMRGTFGSHVRAFELIRSDGSVRECTPTQHADWFAATIGGLGLTGIMSWAEIQLIRIGAPTLHVETIKATSLDEMIALMTESDDTWEYTVSWIDCTQGGRTVGKGHFIRGNFEDNNNKRAENNPRESSHQLINVPVDAPNWLLSATSIKAFNTLYYHRQFATMKRGRTSIDPFFYPLDVIGGWNKLYGNRGFMQWQCVVPYDGDASVMRHVLSEIKRAGMASFLAVLKMFGDRPSPGILSFPRPGLTLALDFGNDGVPLMRMLDTLDAIVADVGGRIYPAKDAHVSAVHFQQMYPEASRLAAFIDPHCTSTFWQRVHTKAQQ